MSTNSTKTIILLPIIILLFAVFAVNAQPPKKRGVGVKPKTATTTAQPQQTSPPANQTQQMTSASASPPVSAKKKTIVVLDFNDVSLTTDSLKRPIGKQLAVLLTTEFAKNGNYSVISQRDKEIAEERIKSLKEGKDKSYAAKIGKQLSANLVVFGDIIEYTITTEDSGMLINKKVKNEAKVGFTLTLVDVNTNEVKDGVTIEHVISSTDSDWVYISKSTKLTEEQRISMLTAASKVGVSKAVCQLSNLINSSNQKNQTTVNPCEVEKATVKENDNNDEESVFGKINPFKKKKKKNDNAGKIPDDLKIPAEVSNSNIVAVSSIPNLPRIAQIEGKEIYIKNLPAGTKVGTKLVAYQIGKVLKDSETGEIIKQEELTVAELEVVSILDSYFVCKIISGAGLTNKTLIKVVK